MFASDFPVAGLHACFDEVYDSFVSIVAVSPRASSAPCSSTRRDGSIVLTTLSAAGLPAGEEQQPEDQRAEQDAAPAGRGVDHGDQRGDRDQQDGAGDGAGIGAAPPRIDVPPSTTAAIEARR